MQAIPVFVLEEHHEALIAWHYAIRNGLLPPANNMLLHLDEHADLAAPRMRRPLPPLDGDHEQFCRFVFEEIAIFEFIVPAIYEGIFDQVYWLLPRPTPKHRQELPVYSEAGRRRVLRIASTKSEMEADGRTALFAVQDLSGSIAPRPSVALDIDLDYFSCEQAERKRERLEVVESEYRAFREDPYHFLKLNQGSRIDIVEENGRYFVSLKEYVEDAVCPLKVPESGILARIEALKGLLRTQFAPPKMITIARSRISGYTPADQWEFIEAELLAALRTLYTLDVIPMSRLLPWTAAV